MIINSLLSYVIKASSRKSRCHLPRITRTRFHHSSFPSFIFILSCTEVIWNNWKQNFANLKLFYNTECSYCQCKLLYCSVMLQKIFSLKNEYLEIYNYILTTSFFVCVCSSKWNRESRMLVFVYTHYQVQGLCFFLLNFGSCWHSPSISEEIFIFCRQRVNLLLNCRGVSTVQYMGLQIRFATPTSKNTPPWCRCLPKFTLWHSKNSC